MTGLQNMISQKMFGKKKKTSAKPKMTVPPAPQVAPSMPPAGIAVGKKVKL